MSSPKVEKVTAISRISNLFKDCQPPNSWRLNHQLQIESIKREKRFLIFGSSVASKLPRRIVASVGSFHRDDYSPRSSVGGSAMARRVDRGGGEKIEIPDSKRAYG
jgi:hypothetical protein